MKIGRRLREVGEASSLCSWEEAKRGRFAYTGLIGLVCGLLNSYKSANCTESTFERVTVRHTTIELQSGKHEYSIFLG
jgi:hypothetical protein